MDNFNVICRKLLKEELKQIILKYSYTILLTESWCIKIVNYPDKNCKSKLKNELNWNTKERVKTEVFVDFLVNGTLYSGLIIRKLNQKDNVLQKIFDDNLSETDITNLGKKIVSLSNHYYTSNASYKTIQKDHIKNFFIQMSFLKHKLNSNFTTATNKWFENNQNDILQLLQVRVKKKCIRLVHGDTFSSNIYIEKNNILIIDRSYTIYTRRLDIVAELAMLCCDFCLISPKHEKILFQTDEVQNIYDSEEKLLFQYYYILKSLVKIRYCLLEKEISNLEVHKWAHQKIIDNYNELLKMI